MRKHNKIITMSVIISVSLSSLRPGQEEIYFTNCNVASMVTRDFFISEMHYLLHQQQPFHKIKNLMLITASIEKSILWTMT